MLRKAIFCVAAASLALLTSCATPGAPMPPSLQLPQPVDDLNFVRKGQRVVLTWTPPSQTTEHLGLRHPGVTYICRSVGRYPVDACEMIKRLSPADVELVTDRQREVAVFEDVLPGQVLSPAGFATYSIEVFNDRGRAAGLSNQVRVPLAPTMPPPTDLHAKLTAEGPVLEWTATAPAAAAGVSYEYRVLRRLDTAPSFTVVDNLPIESSSFVDHSFEWERKYEYKIEPVTMLVIPGQPSGEVDGDDSPIVTVETKDVFPPAQPVGVQAVFSSVGQKAFIDLTWTPNSESDLAGYNVYRRQGDAAPVKLTAQPVQAPSYRDNDVKPGEKYFYYVVAVDMRGNQSAASPEASESLPADAH